MLHNFLYSSIYIYVCDYFFFLYIFFSKEKSLNFIYTKKICILNNAFEIVHLV